MTTHGTSYRVLRAIAISLMLGVVVFISVFFGMVLYAEHKYPLHNSTSGIEAFVVGAIASLSVFALSLCLGLIVSFVRKATDPNTTY
jgi:hypothetical protein